ncbi:hypothetical protein EJB05_57817, partial [Eragrostis curvula]
MESRKPKPSALVDSYVGLAVVPLTPPPLPCPGARRRRPGPLGDDQPDHKDGAGLRQLIGNPWALQECDTIQATSAGMLRLSKPNKYWVESSQKRYIPSVEDTVLGVVVDTKPD